MKTIDEAAKDYLKNVIGCISEHAGKCAMHDFTEGVLFAQRWIPVEEEMPELKSIVLCVNGFSPFVAIYYGEQDGFRIPNVIGEYKVTHWRAIKLF